MTRGDIISRSQRHESEALCDHALQIINEEYMNEDLSLTDASDKLGVSPNYLSALIKRKKVKEFCCPCDRKADESGERSAFVHLDEDI